MKPLKIGFVFDDSLDKLDGVPQYVLSLGRWLSQQGHEVHYLVGQTRRTDLPNVYSLARNITVRFNQNRTDIPLPARRRPIRRIVEREQFDILHVQVPYSPALAARVIRAVDDKTAVVGTFHVAPHSHLVTAATRLLGLWLRPTLRRFDVMLATSEPAAAFARTTFAVESQVIPLPVPLQGFSGAKGFKRYQAGQTVVFLGRLVERKGCQHLLEAVAYAVQQGNWPASARVVVCGRGPLEQRLKQYAHGHGLGEIVEFVGFITEADKPRYLASADIVAYPSTGGESFGIVLLEAMAASPGMVLAGNNPGYASVMAPRPESLFDPHHTEGFAAKLVAALQDTAARQAAHEWQTKYVQQFDISLIGARTVDIYRQALRKRRTMR